MSCFTSAAACAVDGACVPETGGDDGWVICGLRFASVDK